MNSNDTPVTIGVEVECRYPSRWPNEEIAEKALPIMRKRFPVSSEPRYLLGLERPDPSRNSAFPVGDDVTGFGSAHYRPVARQTHLWEHAFPKQYRTPEGWERGWDENLEFRFLDYASSIEDAFNRFDGLQTWMDAWGIDNFQGCGTHIHLGVKDMLEDVFPGSTASNSSWMVSVPANLLYGYIITRAKAMWKVIDPKRERDGNCTINNYGASSDATPLYQIHNYWAHGGYSSAISRARGHLPTFEVRMFSATREMGAVKGYTALLVSMMKHAFKYLKKCDFPLSTLLISTDADEVFTKHILRQPFQYTINSLKDEIKETGWWSDALCSWIDSTVKNGGKPTLFEGQLTEIYGTNYAAATPLAAAA